MTKKSIPSSSSLVEFKKIDGKKVLATTSLQIAELFTDGKGQIRHDNVLSQIRNLLDSGEFSALNFQGTSYKDIQNKTRPMYLLDETFTRVLLGRFTGKEALKWQIRYAEEFVRMRSIVQRQVGDSSAELNKAVNYVLEAQRRLAGQKTEQCNYENLACAVNREVFGEHRKGIRQEMTPEQQTKLNKALTAKAKQILDACR